MSSDSFQVGNWPSSHNRSIISRQFSRWSSVMSLMGLRDRTGAARRGERAAGQKGAAAIALFNRRLSKVIILSAAARISLYSAKGTRGERSERGDSSRNWPNVEEGFGLQVYAAVCGQHYSPRALSAPPLIVVFVAAPTISLPFPYTRPPTLRSTSLAQRRLAFSVYAHATPSPATPFLSTLFITSGSRC